MLSIFNLTKSYGDNLILHQLTFQLHPGERIGLIGPNGCGKSTLLHIIAGYESADQGSVQLNSPHTRWGYLEQGLSYAAGETVGELLHVHARALQTAIERVEELATTLATVPREEQDRWATAYNAALIKLEALTRAGTQPHTAQAVLAGLELDALSLTQPVAILSGGQKTRLGLARLLIQQPDILLLDEPTNHLDITTLEWLETWLREYRGAVLLVSHDRTFLDNTVTKIIELNPDTHAITEYAGGYSAYIAAWQRQREKQWRQWHNQEAEIKRLHADIGTTKTHALKVELTTTSGQPNVRRLAKKVARKAKSREKKLERYLKSAERVEKPTLHWKMKLEFTETPASGQEVLRLEELAVGYNQVALMQHINVTLRAGERIALLGPNAAGKTTLLRVILGQLAPLHGHARLGANVQVGYYAQEQKTLEPHSTPFETIRRSAALSETAARNFLHYFLFSGDAVFLPIAALSYGERARLTLARLVASGCNFLVLDEPINHLDIPSRECFEQAMTAFEGSVLAVTHDRCFIQQFATRIWALQDHTLRQYLDLEELQRVSAG
ncbi:MAG: ABC-F family ATP-binding cassette domain-containing protein [Chloroflexota bacterium]|nr:ABC-F family ATP-binding cassette domain-containing protein [Chloroflexota bacterium]